MIPETIRVYQSPSVCSEILNSKEELERHAAAGYFPLPEEAHLAANYVAPAADTEILRTDGPTLKEFLSKNYPESAYPPKGYAVRVDPEADARLDAHLKAEADAAAEAEAKAKAAETPAPSAAMPPEGKPSAEHVPAASTIPPDGAPADTGKAPAADTKPAGKQSAKG